MIILNVVFDPPRDDTKTRTVAITWGISSLADSGENIKKIPDVDYIRKQLSFYDQNYELVQVKKKCEEKTGVGRYQMQMTSEDLEHLSDVSWFIESSIFNFYRKKNASSSHRKKWYASSK